MSDAQCVLVYYHSLKVSPLSTPVQGVSAKPVCVHAGPPYRPVPARPRQRPDHRFLWQRAQGGDHAGGGEPEHTRGGHTHSHVSGLFFTQIHHQVRQDTDASTYGENTLQAIHTQKKKNLSEFYLLWGYINICIRA